MTDLQYPIGKYQAKATVSPQERRAAIEQIAQLPGALSAALLGLAEEQLDTRYRPEGWTVRQVTHHLADAHMNGFVRFKLALTEEDPAIKPYAQARWAELSDSSEAAADVSLELLEALHKRWVTLLETMRPDEFARRLNHVERGLLTLDQLLCLYAWHGRHHVAHITSLRERNGWR
jgi:hypothetical protein